MKTFLGYERLYLLERRLKRDLDEEV